MTSYAVKFLAARPDPDDPRRCFVRAPLGARVLQVIAQGDAPLFGVLAEVGVVVDLPFLVIPGSEPFSPLVGREIGQGWMIDVGGPVWVFQDLPWPTRAFPPGRKTGEERPLANWRPV